MFVYKVWAGVALCLGLVGCSRLEEAAMPVADKINAAYPPSPEARVAQERLLALMAEDSKARDALQQQLSARLTLRALACVKDAAIGRLDSVASVKALALPAPCFQEQDTELLKFYGLRTVGELLARPPLRPLKPAGPVSTLARGKLSIVSGAAVARDAGVGVLRDHRGEGAVVEVPGGAVIAQLPGASAYGEGAARLSPNGRVAVLASPGQGPVFVEAETGNRIWSPGGSTAPRVLAWLPEVGAFLMTSAEGDVLLADGQTGRTEVHPLSLKNSNYAAHLPGAPARVLMGTARELVLVSHTRSAQGITATALKRYNLSNGPGITSGQPVPMRGGQFVVYASLRDIGWLKLDDGSSGTWRTSPLFGVPFAKLDENRLMLDAVSRDASGVQAWAFDITQETVAPIDLGVQRGQIVDIGERVGFLRRSQEVWFGDQVSTGTALPLDKPVAEYELQLQLAKLQAQSRENGETVAAFERPGFGPSPAPGPVAPGLSGVPADAQVHIVGVYEGQRRGNSPSVGHPRRDVRVVVLPSARPVVLVLASYEPVNWMVVNSGTPIAAVLLSGYYPSDVNGVGLGATPVLRIGSAYAYAASSPEYAQLRQAVARYTGAREIRSFQGSYSGSDFRVGGR